MKPQRSSMESDNGSPPKGYHSLQAEQRRVLKTQVHEAKKAVREKDRRREKTTLPFTKPNKFNRVQIFSMWRLSVFLTNKGMDDDFSVTNQDNYDNIYITTSSGKHYILPAHGGIEVDG